MGGATVLHGAGRPPVGGGRGLEHRHFYEPMLLLEPARTSRVATEIVFHSGTIVLPGSTNSYADPALVEDVLRDVPKLTTVRAHGGRG